MNEFIITALGYAASVLLAISLLVTNDLRFRWLNTWGCACFIAYGILINALPIIITNSILLLINAYYLFKLYNAKEDFDLIEFKGGEKLVYKFLSFYREDIKNYFPGYIHNENEGDLKFVVLRDLVIANIFIAEVDSKGDAHIKLNYTVSRYRDYKVGEFIFSREQSFLLSKGVERLMYDEVLNKQHERFIKVMGFRRMDDGSWIKNLA